MTAQDLPAGRERLAVRAAQGGGLRVDAVEDARPHGWSDGSVRAVRR
jgi:hypothetical protein